MQLGGCVVAEEDEHPVVATKSPTIAPDRGDRPRRTHLGQRPVVAEVTARLHVVRLDTPDTNSSSVMNWASGPAGDVAWMSTVSTFFIG